MMGLPVQAQIVEEKPTVNYTGTPRQCEIGGIRVQGIKNYEDYVLIGISGLSVGQTISLPGDEITSAIKRYWRHGLFSNARIEADSIVDGKVYLNIILAPRPRISEIEYSGVKKSEREDLQNKLGLVKGNQITPNMIDRSKILIKKYFDEKGFKNADVNIVQTQEPDTDDQMRVLIDIDKHDKVKVNQIIIEGNQVLSDKKINGLLKKTNEKNKLANFFKTKKFIQEKYAEDKERVIEKYNELGYRDATIVTDSVYNFDESTVNIYMEIDEGQRYYVRNISWLGNTVLTTDQLNAVLNMKRGDVYNQKHINNRTQSDEDAIGNYYYNNGYVFFGLDPVEVNIDNDSIDLEMRITEGPQASISHIRIIGNDRLYEDVVRRELRTKPGDLFSKEAMERSYREIAQMGHFNPETIKPDVKPDPTNGTVDINYELESKANDQIEFSAGWGQTGVIGKIGLKFTNFSMRNLFNKEARRRAFLPQGDGETFSINGQTNGSYYQSYSVTYMNPWFGGKRPNTLSVTGFFSKQTDVSSSFYSNAYMSSMMYGYGYGGYGGMYGGYGGYGGYGYPSYENFYDPDKSVKLWGITVGFGKRLRWPDDYFQGSLALTFQRYELKDWQYFIISNGNSNNINLSANISRNSIDNTIYPRRGSEFSLEGTITPPWSAFDGKDYTKLATNPKSPTYQKELAEKYKWIEYYKVKFKSKTYTALANGAKAPVLMTRMEFGYLGSYNKNKRSPFETFYVGGDGMTGYSSSYATETIGLRGYENGSLTPWGREGYAYSRLSLELRYALMLETSTSIYALGFVEGGNAWNNAKNFNPFDMKRSAGVGVRIFLPMIGMMGIDWAYGFDPINGRMDYSKSHFHFIIGQEF
ncbi:MAG: outer membrane protein assembly factor BamA [Bacteroidaceae bacterium]|nr:outer membrane protein assembly factor BamA [Bacteroidaceae bacterium]